MERRPSRSSCRWERACCSRGWSRVAPRAARAIPPGLRVPVLRLDPRNFELAGARFLDDFAGWRWPLLLAGLLAAGGAALLAGGLRGAVFYLGVTVAAAALLVAGAVVGLGELVVSHAAHSVNLSDATERGAVRALWSALFADLRSVALVAGLAGAIVATLASTRSPAVYLSASVAVGEPGGRLVQSRRPPRPGRGPDRSRVGDPVGARARRTRRRGRRRRAGRADRRLSALLRPAGGAAGCRARSREPAAAGRGRRSRPGGNGDRRRARAARAGWRTGQERRAARGV